MIQKDKIQTATKNYNKKPKQGDKHKMKISTTNKRALRVKYVLENIAMVLISGRSQIRQ